MLHMDAVRRQNGGQFPLVKNAKITNMKNVLQHAFVGKMKSQGKSTAAETVLFCTGLFLVFEYFLLASLLLQFCITVTLWRWAELE